MSKLKIMAERCNQCLFGPDKIVSNKRRAEILREIRRQDSYFICHKSSVAGLKIACHGDWEQNRCGNLGRVMSRIGGIEFVSEPGAAQGIEAGGRNAEGGSVHESPSANGGAPSLPALPATDALAAVKAGEDERRSHHGA